MIRKPLYVLALASTLVLSGCLDEWLTTEPQTILTDDQVWTDPQLIVGVLADYYDRLASGGTSTVRESPESWAAWDGYDEGVQTGQTTGNVGATNIGSPANYSYALIRDIHVAMAGIEPVSDATLVGQKARFLAELRFLRAYLYFDMVKRHGGVPLITERLNFTGNVEELQVPRASEAEVYDFIFSELMAIKNDLPRQPSQKQRATWGAAMALISRSQLYAASIATHNYGPTLASPILLTDNNTGKLVVGIPQARAAEFYQRSLAASDSLLAGSSGYALKTGANPSASFHSIFTEKSNNNEAIFVKDFGGTKFQFFTFRGRPPTMKVALAQNWTGSEIAATLNVVENFDRLDGTRGTVRGVGDGSVASQANWIFYDTPVQILQGYDARLKATVLGPGDTLGTRIVDVQRGVYRWDGTKYVAENATTARTTDPVFGRLLGPDGAIPTGQAMTTTSFFIKKYLSGDDADAQGPPLGDDTWLIYFRLGEIYMNATEAAFQLGQTAKALAYINTLRQRAGFPANSLTSLTMQKIQQERWSELAYEDQRLWDLRRWRIAHEVWNGNLSNPSARIWVLYPYRIYRPGHPDNGKWVFDRTTHILATGARNFDISNYYTEFPAGARTNNPLLLPNSGAD